MDNRFPIVDAEISIHAPLTGSDLIRVKILPGQKIFQSTLPLRGATGMARSAR